MLAVQVEVLPEISWADEPGGEAARALAEELQWAIRDEIGLHARVILLRLGSLPRSEGKAVRVEDLRRE